MGENKRLTIGLLAHVDAGKTTLAEALLFAAGAIRQAGRVDHRNTFLDTDAQERERGITIFAKQAELRFGDTEIMLMDTPGHVDFCAETERTLRVLDYAILIINGKDGVQQHTETLWRLLSEYGIPTFIWVNKMDLLAVDKTALKAELSEKLDTMCIELGSENFLEDAAVCDEGLMEKYLAEGSLSDEDVAGAINGRKLFPCLYGSALKSGGLDALIEAIQKYTLAKSYRDDFAARVYKIGRDERGARLTYMKLTGGTLSVKETISTGETDEKVDRLLVYSGDKARMIDKAEAGMLVAASGLENSYAGQSLGVEKPGRPSALSIGKLKKLACPASTNSFKFMQDMFKLEEEQPELQVYVTEEKEILVRILGDVQAEVLENLIRSRLGVEATLEDYVPPVYEEEEEIEEEIIDDRPDLNARWLNGSGGSGADASDEELQKIFERTYGPQKETVYKPAEQRATVRSSSRKEEIRKEYILVDGYNVIYAWEDLRELGRTNIDSAREALIDMLCNYRSQIEAEVIVVFDAYKVKGGANRTEKHSNIYVIYTGEAESADTYIERTTYELRKKHHATVVTSDVAEQIITLSNNANVLKADMFRKEVEAANENLRKWMEDYRIRQHLSNLNRIKLPEKPEGTDTEK